MENVNKVTAGVSVKNLVNKIESGSTEQKVPVKKNIGKLPKALINQIGGILKPPKARINKIGRILKHPVVNVPPMSNNMIPKTADIIAMRQQKAVNAFKLRTYDAKIKRETKISESII
jgi:hypothetical protein